MHKTADLNSIATPTLAFVVGACVLAFSWAGPAFSENWLDMQSTSSEISYRLDTDSVRPESDGRYLATWQHKIAVTNSITTDSGVVDCKALALSRDRSSSGKITYDYLAGTYSVHGFARTMQIDDRSKPSQFTFPTPSSGEGLIIKHVCGPRAWGPEKMSTAADEIRTSLCVKYWAAAPFCTKDPAMDELLHTLFVRAQQVQDACSIDSKRMTTVINDALRGSLQCKAGDRACGLSALDHTTYVLGTDLARSVVGMPCVHAPVILERAAKEQANGEAMTKFRACTAKTIPALDDRTSQADVIAIAVFSKCRRELVAHEYGRSEAFEAALRPSITAAVLEHRTSVRKTAPAKLQKSKHVI